ncbi:hypothetical protein CAEBREN_04274 [Caenorhabditis brenneri]|uniref:Uncharacterized protein n=1 Tax=Caenorhabditis brenneri TaxID=135651 RepID=G0MBG8_CAEBE|nr:hypothetical protein CAEBREN_04274 [Caenorhabditis brenneri]
MRKLRVRIKELEMKEMAKNREDVKRDAAFRRQGRILDRQGFVLEKELKSTESLREDLLRLKDKLKKKRRHAFEDWEENESLRRKIKKMKAKKRVAQKEARRARREAARLKWENANNELIREGLRALLMEEERMERLEKEKMEAKGVLEIYRREIELARGATKAIKASCKNALVEHKQLLLALLNMNDLQHVQSQFSFQ